MLVLHTADWMQASRAKDKRDKPIRYQAAGTLAKIHTFWANDLTSEAYAEDWPANIDEGFGNAGLATMLHGGNIGKARANAVTAILILDLGSPSGMYGLAVAAELLDQHVAARIGIVVVGHLTSRYELAKISGTGGQDVPHQPSTVGAQLAATFRAIQTKLGCRSALDWARRLQATCELSSSSTKDSSQSLGAMHHLTTVPRQMPEAQAIADVTASFLKEHRKAKAGINKHLKTNASRAAEEATTAALLEFGLGEISAKPVWQWIVYQLAP
eukprot:SAG31_NODE_124_length_23684_cov_7.200127_4_plen_271_part_00